MDPRQVRNNKKEVEIKEEAPKIWWILGKKIKEPTIVFSFLVMKEGQ